MEKQTLNTTSSALMEMLKRETEEERAIFHAAIARLQARFDTSLDVPFVPSAVAEPVTQTQANARLDAALRRVSVVELENVSLQDRLHKKEEENLELQQIQKMTIVRDASTEKARRRCEEEIQSVTFLHEKEVAQLLQRIDAHARENHDFRFYHESTVYQLHSYIKELEDALEASRVKSHWSREAFVQEMQANHCLHEKRVADMSDMMDALLDNNDELNSKMMRLEVALKEESESKQQKTDAAADTEGKLETVELGDDLLQKQWQMQHADTIAKKVEQMLRADIVELQRRLNEEIYWNNEHKVHIGKLKEELRAFQEQPRTNRFHQQQQTRAASRPHAEKQRLQRLLDQEIQSHNYTRSIIRTLEEEKKGLMASQQIHEAQTNNAPRQGQVKKGKHKLDSLLKEFNKKVEECKTLERKNHIHICTLQDLRKEIESLRGASVKSKVEQESLTDQVEVKIAKQKLQ